MIFLSCYQHFTDTCPVKTTMENIVRLIKDDASVAAKTAAHRNDPQAGHKSACPLFAVAAVMEGGKSERHIVEMTGVSMVDVDHISQHTDSPGACDKVAELFQRLITDPHTLLCYRTISGDGIRTLFRYELDERYDLALQKRYYPKAFLYGNEYYARTYGVVYDEQCKNVGRLSGVAHDPEVYYNPDAVPFGKEEIQAAAEQELRRKRERRKRERELKRITACYEQVIRPEVEADGAVYAPGSHNDYVMRVGYKLNQFGFSPEAAREWACQTFREYEMAGNVVDSCYRKTEEFGVRNRHKSRSSRPPQGDSLYWATVEDIQAFLTAHIKLRHNIITGRVEYATPSDSPSSGGESGHWEPITDRVMNSLWCEMSKTQKVNSQDIYRVVQSDYVPQYHPFREYLEGLETKTLQTPSGSPCLGGEDEGEEHDYIRDLANTITLKCPPPKQGESEGVWHCYLKKWLVAMIAGWLDPTVVNNVILVLIGEQGSYKTTWFSYLLPPPLRCYFYTKTNANRMGRDDLLTLAQYGLVCCEELDTMRPSELNQLKAAVTMTTVDERAAYAHFHEHRPHIASFCGTGNNKQFLSDPTGNRRWLPFEVEAIRSPRDHPLDYDGIYRQAYRLYKSGYQYWFSQDEIKRLAEHNRQFETPRLEQELVDTYFRVPENGEQGEFMTISMAIQTMGGNLANKLNHILVGRAFVEKGFQSIRRSERGYVVMRRSTEEIKIRNRQLANVGLTFDG